MQKEKDIDLFRENVNYLAISNYNLGVEYDHLRKYKEANGYYK